jgi:hypothetical protein
MIHPSIYNTVATYRGPKHSKELSKLFTSIVHDLGVANNELDALRQSQINNLLFCLKETNTTQNIPVTNLNGEQYKYVGVDNLSNKVNNIKLKANKIMAELQEVK